MTKGRKRQRKQRKQTEFIKDGELKVEAQRLSQIVGKRERGGFE